jgi:hypothetical protein
MRRLILPLLIFAAASLSGCAGARFITASVSNPVTPDVLYQTENIVTVAFAGLGAYRRACILNAVDLRCRENIRAIQPYTRQVRPLLVQLRTFVRTNDQVNAAVIYNQLVAIMNTLQTEAVARGIQIGAAK